MSAVLSGTSSHASAALSPCEKYRYELRRDWDASKPPLVLCMINPSRADADVADPTISKCIGFARRLGFGGILVVNLYAYRTPYVRALLAAGDDGTDIVGPENDLYIIKAAWTAAHSLSPIVCAWGAKPRVPSDWQQRIGILKAAAAAQHVPLQCLGVTKNGDPAHPLMLSYDRKLQAWPSAVAT